MMPAAGAADRARIATAALRGVTRVARLADGDAPPEWPVAQEARHDERQSSQAGPPGNPAMTGAGTRLVGTARLSVYAAGDAATAVHAVVEEPLDATQTGRVIQHGFGRAEARVVAEPPAGQWGWFPARLASTLVAEITYDREPGWIVVSRAEGVGRLLGEGHWLLRHGVRRRRCRVRRRGDGGGVGCRAGAKAQNLMITCAPAARPMRRHQRYVRRTLVTPMMTMIVVMMPPFDLRTIAGALTVDVETPFLVAASVLERCLDVLVDGPLAVRSRRGETYLADRASRRRCRRCGRRYRRFRGRRQQVPGIGVARRRFHVLRAMQRRPAPEGIR